MLHVLVFLGNFVEDLIAEEAAEVFVFRFVPRNGFDLLELSPCRSVLMFSCVEFIQELSSSLWVIISRIRRLILQLLPKHPIGFYALSLDFTRRQYFFKTTITDFLR
jgi:hypothetical protein